MTAMTQPRRLTERASVFSKAPVKGATTILQGAIVVTQAGLAVPGKTALSLTVLGVSEQTVANSGADGAKSVLAKSGTFKFFNLAADAIGAGDVRQDCYLVDDQTVAKTDGNGTRSKAGKIIDVDADGVWVSVG